MHSKSVFHTWATNFGLANHEMQPAWEAWDAHERLMHGEYKKLQMLYVELMERHNRLIGSLNKKPETDTKTKSLF
jgi:hypothetical protein